ncbi:hypothetical protein SAMN05428984_2899 [Sphingomonas sp. OK281]|nr:hypothetical protein SAMN05428984_2899 [Sphingomonas sp. OK281]
MMTQTHHQIHSTTPAKAGAQLGDAANEPQPLIINAFPTEPRPSPELGLVGGSLDAIARGLQ